VRLTLQCEPDRRGKCLLRLYEQTSDRTFNQLGNIGVTLLQISRLVQPFNRELRPKLLTFHLLVLAVLADAARQQQREQRTVAASLMILGDCL
jgi:hypothetical protein